MANWTDQTQQVFTEEDLKAKWGLHGGKLYCSLCNKDFQVGDKWRWVNASLHPTSLGNFQVCEQCDGPDVMDRYKVACDLVYKSMKGRGQHHWPIDIAAKLIAAKKSLEQVEDVLTDNWVCVEDNDYKSALNRLIGFNIQIALDPAVNGGSVMFTKEECQILNDLLKGWLVSPKVRKVLDKLKVACEP